MKIGYAKYILGFVGLLIFFAAIFLVFFDGAASEPVPANTLVLLASENSGHDPAWEKRHYYGRKTWGIRGSGVPEDGNLWFDAFPGESGTYRVTMGVILEQDGSPHYSLKAGERVLKEGRFPYLKGEKNCDERGAPTRFELGEHFLEKGERISVWGKSVYECGEKGAYTLWHDLRFTKSGSLAK